MLALVSMGGSTEAAYSDSTSYLGWLLLLWFLGAGGAALALVVSLVAWLRYRGQTAGGIIAGVAVAVLPLGATCFVNLTVFWRESF